jgi:integrase/recombinase XerD
MVALTPCTAAALDVMLAGRGIGPLFTTRTGRRMDRHAALKVVRRLARAAGIEHSVSPIEHSVSPHSLRHRFVTLALDAGDLRTTRRYDRGRHSLDRAAMYTVASYVAT